MKMIFEYVKRKVQWSGRWGAVWLLLLSSVSVMGQAEEGKEVGYIRLVHALAAGEGRLTLRLNERDVYPSGYRLGDATGGIGVKVGVCDVVIERDGVETGRTTVDVVAGKTTSLVAFAEKVPADHKKPVHWKARILRLKQAQPERGRSVIFVSVSSQPKIEIEMGDPEGNWHAGVVEQFGIAKMLMKHAEGYVPLRVGEQRLESIPVMSRGAYVVVLYDDVEGTLRAIHFRDYRQLAME